VFLAYVVEIGPPGTLLHLKGVIESTVDDMDEFDFSIDPGQGFAEGSITTALLQDGTRIFSSDGVEVDESNITVDTTAGIDGIFATDPDGTFYKTALLLLDLEISGDTVLRGSILTTDDASRQLVLDVDGSSECVDVPEAASIFLISQDEDGAISEEGSFEDLTPGLRTNAYGAYEEVGGCLVADSILAFPVLCEDATDCATGEFCAKADGACGEPGQCLVASQICTREFRPVCGCDGETYSNACVANAAGVSVDYDGECDAGGGPPVSCGGESGVACSEGELCVIPRGSCQPLAGGFCLPEPEQCADVVDPVCGCDGETYTNGCEATKAGATIDTQGACEMAGICGGVFGRGCSEGELCLIEAQSCDPFAEGRCVKEPAECPDSIAPVCGCDDVSYDNACVAAVSGAPIAYKGECEGAGLCGGPDELTCLTGDVCLRKVGLCDTVDEGICIAPPELCPRVIDPVCGCDDVTYDNACLAYQAGAGVQTFGACEAAPPGVCGGILGTECAEDELCLLEPGVCVADGIGRCVPGVESCEGIPTKPVCGCDGETYPNLCEATRNSVAASEGECEASVPEPTE
jgi:hypothetical protein